MIMPWKCYVQDMEMSLRESIKLSKDVINNSYIWNGDQAVKMCLFLHFSSQAVFGLHSSFTAVATLHFHDFCVLVSNPDPLGAIPTPPYLAPAKQKDLHSQEPLAGG